MRASRLERGARGSSPRATTWSSSTRTAGSFRLLGDDFPGQCIVGAAIDWDVLREAGIEGADAFAAVTDGDNTNIVCALIAARAFEVHVLRRARLRPAPRARLRPTRLAHRVPH